MWWGPRRPGRVHVGGGRPSLAAGLSVRVQTQLSGTEGPNAVRYPDVLMPSRSLEISFEQAVEKASPGEGA